MKRLTTPPKGYRTLRRIGRKKKGDKTKPMTAKERWSRWYHRNREKSAARVKRWKKTQRSKRRK